MRCLLVTLGKDAPGVNAVIRSGTRLALRQGMEVFGARRGFQGILDNKYLRMREADVGSVLGRGGSMLGSSDFRLLPSDRATLGRMALSLKQFDLVVATGGLGSFAILNKLYTEHDVGMATTMFVPASVENEFINSAAAAGKPDAPAAGLVHAEAVGADTAANTAIEAIDRLREQSYLSRTVFLVECAGLKSNFLPIQIGAACGAHRVYLPRYPRLDSNVKQEVRKLFGEGFDPNEVNVPELVGWIEQMFDEAGRSYLVVIVPSGMPLVSTTYRGQRGSGSDNYEGVVTSMAPLELTLLRLVDELSMHFADVRDVQIRYVVIDDLQLGGSPTLRDRLLGSLYGEAALEEFFSIYNAHELEKRGQLWLLGISDTSNVSWRRYERENVAAMFEGPDPRVGGLNPLPFFRQMRGIVSGYRPWAELDGVGEKK